MLTGEQSNVEEHASRLRVPERQSGAVLREGFEIVGCVHAVKMRLQTRHGH